MASQTSKSTKHQADDGFSEPMKMRNFVIIGGMLSAISVAVSVACLVSLAFNKECGNSNATTPPNSLGHSGLHKLPILVPVSHSRRLSQNPSRRTDDSVDFDDGLDDLSGWATREYAMDKAAYMAAVQLYDSGYEAFQYEATDVRGHHTQHVDMIRKDDLSLSEDEYVVLAAERMNGKIQMQVAVICPEYSPLLPDASTEENDILTARKLRDECRLVMPDIHEVESARRLSEEGSTLVSAGFPMPSLVQLIQVQIGMMAQMMSEMTNIMTFLRNNSDSTQTITNNYVTHNHDSGTTNNYITETNGGTGNNNGNNNGADNDVDTGCFPLDTMVMFAGSPLPIQDAKVGMQLLSSQGPSPFFLQGHADPKSDTAMMQIDTLSNHSVKASFEHYFPLVSGTHAAVMHLSLGDELWVNEEGSMVPSPIVGLQVVTAKGLFNPYTVAGDIIVNGILASSHSSWFLEGTGMSDATIVTVYTALFSPLSLLYRLKPDAFGCFHEELGTTGALSNVAASKLVSFSVGCLMS